MKTKNKPKTRTFDGIAAAAGALGIDAAILRWAKKQGAPGFINGRVNADRLLPWLEKNQPTADSPAVTKEQAILHRVLEQVRDLKRKNNEKERILVPRAWVAERMGAACAEWNRTRQMGKDSRCLTQSAEHGVPVAMARALYDQTTEDGGAALKQLAAVFVEPSDQPKP